nr:hypothetical protein [uncultured Bdellovibrio sp.]
MKIFAALMVCVLSFSISANAGLLEDNCKQQALEIVESTRKTLHDYQPFDLQANLIGSNLSKIPGIARTFEYDVLMIENNGALRPVHYLVYMGVTSLNYDRCDAVLNVRTVFPPAPPQSRPGPPCAD